MLKLNTISGRVDIYPFANRNSVLLDTTGDIFDQKNIFSQLIALFKGEADSILNKEESMQFYYSNKEGNKVNNSNDSGAFILDETSYKNSFDFISNKDEIILNKKEALLEGIKTNGKIYSKDDLEYFLKKNLSISLKKLCLLLEFFELERL